MRLEMKTVVTAGLLAASACAWAQNFPVKPVRIIMPFPAGTSVNDVLGRALAQRLSEPLGQQVIFDNRSGAAGTLGSEMVVKAPPDGYSVLSHGGALAMGALMQKMPYDPLKDFAAISWTASAPLVVTVHPSVPVKSVKELIALAKARPGALNYASTATGSTPHLATELFKHMAGVKITHIPYKGAGAAMIDMISGQVQLIFAVPNAVVEHAKSGRLRTLAVTSAEPSPLLPGLPTVAASGLPGYESVGIYGMFTTARTSDAIIRRLHREFVRVLATDEAAKRLRGNALEVVASTPEQFEAKFRAESARMAQVIQAAGIRME